MFKGSTLQKQQDFIEISFSIVIVPFNIPKPQKKNMFAYLALLISFNDNKF